MIAWMVVPVIALAGLCLLWLGRWADSRTEGQPDRAMESEKGLESSREEGVTLVPRPSLWSSSCSAPSWQGSDCRLGGA